MAQLLNATTQKIVLKDLKSATTFWQRFIGLMGQKDLPADSGLWISNCTSIHTCFMNFSIDCVFLDQQLKIKSLKENIKPWRMTAPVFGASSVVEVPAGFIRSAGLNVGEVLNVSP